MLLAGLGRIAPHQTAIPLHQAAAYSWAVNVEPITAEFYITRMCKRLLLNAFR
jgi:hypothetical protein